jgi:phosphoribosylaminoimidazole-succinocarboxamide synthase
MTMDEVKDLVGEDLTNRLETKTKEIYKFAQLFARSKGIIIADTKMEFGLIDGELSLIDELLTPDSSRFWDTDGYAPGKSQPNFDKQFVRDWLNTKDWDRNPPAPKLPDDIVEKTRERYLEAAVRLTGRSLS